MKIVPVILAGGSGTRLWPLSRKSYPKQFLNLTSNKSLFQETLLRAECVTDQGAIVITNSDYRFLTAEQVSQIGHEHNGILLEPVQRNTAPAIAAAAVHAINQSTGTPPLLLVLPADHNIENNAAFTDAVRDAMAAAENGKLVTFGIVPTSPETGYGYIKAGKSNNSYVDRPVKQFVEKPNLEKAEEYLKSGNYFWNSGMFLFRADKYLDELEKYNPKMKKACEDSILYSKTDIDFLRLDSGAFKSSPADSIDYAIMEKSEDVVMVPMNAGWSDVGSWSSLANIAQKDENGNTSQGDTLLVDSNNCIVRSEKRFVATLGLDDITIIETPDAVLVAHNSKVQNVKSIVDTLKEEELEIATTHQLVYRPWGKYNSVDSGRRFQVKRLTVKPGEILSLQKHFHRSEHWVVVSGVAEVTRDDEVFILSENESAYIPRGAVHRLHNPGKIPLELIEVQSGSYLGEDDIVRIEDSYGRNKVSNISKKS